MARKTSPRKPGERQRTRKWNAGFGDADEQQRRAMTRADKLRGRPRTPPGAGDPVTSERYYTDEERDFLVAIEQFMVRTGKRFPSWTEALGVLKSLGYRLTEPH